MLYNIGLRPWTTYDSQGDSQIRDRAAPRQIHLNGEQREICQEGRNDRHSQ